MRPEPLPEDCLELVLNKETAGYAFLFAGVALHTDVNGERQVIRGRKPETNLAAAGIAPDFRGIDIVAEHGGIGDALKLVFPGRADVRAHMFGGLIGVAGAKARAAGRDVVEVDRVARIQGLIRSEYPRPVVFAVDIEGMIFGKVPEIAKSSMKV